MEHSVDNVSTRSYHGHDHSHRHKLKLSPIALFMIMTIIGIIVVSIAYMTTFKKEIEKNIQEYTTKTANFTREVVIKRQSGVDLTSIVGYTKDKNKYDIYVTNRNNKIEEEYLSNQIETTISSEAGFIYNNEEYKVRTVLTLSYIELPKIYAPVKIILLLMSFEFMNTILCIIYGILTKQIKINSINSISFNNDIQAIKSQPKVDDSNFLGLNKEDTIKSGENNKANTENKVEDKKTSSTSEGVSGGAIPTKHEEEKSVSLGKEKDEKHGFTSNASNNIAFTSSENKHIANQEQVVEKEHKVDRVSKLETKIDSFFTLSKEEEKAYNDTTINSFESINKKASMPVEEIEEEKVEEEKVEEVNPQTESTVMDNTSVEKFLREKARSNIILQKTNMSSLNYYLEKKLIEKMSNLKYTSHVEEVVLNIDVNKFIESVEKIITTNIKDNGYKFDKTINIISVLNEDRNVFFTVEYTDNNKTSIEDVFNAKYREDGTFEDLRLAKTYEIITALKGKIWAVEKDETTKLICIELKTEN